MELVEASREQAVEGLTLDLREERSALWRLDPPLQRLAKITLRGLAELARDRLDLSLEIDAESIEDRPAGVRHLAGAPLDLLPHACAQNSHQAESRPGGLARAEVGHGQPSGECEQDVLQSRRDELANEDGIHGTPGPASGRRRGRGNHVAEPSADLLW